MAPHFREQDSFVQSKSDNPPLSTGDILDRQHLHIYDIEVLHQALHVAVRHKEMELFWSALEFMGERIECAKADNVTVSDRYFDRKKDSGEGGNGR